ncbi:MAG: hypothetical protein ACRD0L_01355, partial [Acidimicrobiales bacterium]
MKSDIGERAAPPDAPPGAPLPRSAAGSRPGEGAARARPSHRAPRRPTRGRIWLRRLAVLVVLALIPVGWSYGHALTAPGSAGPGVRTVEWVRSHGGAGLVAAAEDYWYSHHPPPKGGKPPPGYIPPPAQAGTSTRSAGPATSAAGAAAAG